MLSTEMRSKLDGEVDAIALSGVLVHGRIALPGREIILSERNSFMFVV